MENNEFSEVEKYLLLLLSANSNKPIPGKLWFQKELFMLSKNIQELDDETDFEPYFWGPYSELAEDEMEELKKLGLVEMINHSYKLTSRGEELAKKISVKKENNELIVDMKTFFNDLSKDELLLFIYVTYPDMVDESVEVKPLLPKRKDIAIELYKKEKTSLGKSAELAGLSVEEFIIELGKRGIKHNEDN